MTEVIVSNNEYKVCQRCNRIRNLLKNGICGSCYNAIRRYTKHINSPMIDCACECGEKIHSIGKHGQPQIFKRGHNSRVAHWAYNFGLTHDTRGYLLLYMPDHPNSMSLGYILIHRFFMSLTLGRPLEKGEVVHHIDGNIHNNDQSNLMLFASQAEHKRYEQTIDDSDRFCVYCGTNKTYIKKNGWKCWARYEDCWLCRNCNRRRLWKLKRKR